MDPWFSSLAAQPDLPLAATAALAERGFAVLPSLVPAERMAGLTEAYDAAVAAATSSDTKTGRTSTRVTDFVNRGPAFDDLYTLPALLVAAAQVIVQPFKLSSFHARTLVPGASGQELHVDLPWQSPDWPLLGFILMIDPFRPDNGATQFVPGTHRRAAAPVGDPHEEAGERVLACGPAGSLLVFHGSVWHGHSSNVSPDPRRSLQGAFIPRTGRAATDFAARMKPETLARLGRPARQILGLADPRVAV